MSGKQGQNCESLVNKDQTAEAAESSRTVSLGPPFVSRATTTSYGTIVIETRTCWQSNNVTLNSVAG